MSLMNKLNELAKSPQIKELTDKAKQIANDPNTRKKFEEAQKKVSEKLNSVNKK